MSRLITQVGEVLDGRFEVRATHGKGVFSTVLLAKDRTQETDSPLNMVAIKVIRAIDTMTKAARLEIKILEAMQQKQSSTGNKNCIRLLDTFMYRGHTCLVFEPMVSLLTAVLLPLLLCAWQRGKIIFAVWGSLP